MPTQNVTRSATRRSFLLTTASVAGAAIIGCAKQPSIKKDGGVVLVYQAAPGVTSEQLTTANAPKLIRHRIDPQLRLRGLAIRVIDGGKIEVSIPNQPAVKLERIKHRLALQGKLEFLIAANAVDHVDAIELARKSKSREVLIDDETVLAKWVGIGDLKDIVANSVPIDQFILRDGMGNAIEIPPALKHAPPKRIVHYLNGEGVTAVEALVVYDVNGKNFNEDALTSVYATKDGTGQVAIGFNASEAGAAILKEVTSKHLPEVNGQRRHLAILLDDQIISAPTIQGVISGKGMISGNFDADQVDDLTAVLRSGRLPFEIQKTPISENAIGPEKE